MGTARKVGGASGAVITLAAAFIMPWEGLWTTAKVDTIGTGRPITWCYGETKGGAKVGDKFTPKQCEEMLKKRIPEYADAIDPCIQVPISDKTRSAFISFAYNVGSAGFCRSSVGKKLNAGDARGACDAMLQWNRAQGRFVKGLDNRRRAERKVCLEGINEPPPPELSFRQKAQLAIKSIWKGI